MFYQLITITTTSIIIYNLGSQLARYFFTLDISSCLRYDLLCVEWDVKPYTLTLRYFFSLVSVTLHSDSATKRNFTT